MPIYKDKERGTWYFEFVKTINGVQYRKKKRGFKTKSEATIAVRSFSFNSFYLKFILCYFVLKIIICKLSF